MSAVVDAPDREQVRRRLRAARMLGDFSTPKDLSSHPLCQANGITASLIIETERKARDALPMELETIAEACGLPRGWFVVPFARLEDGGLDGRVAELEAKLDAINVALDQLSASRMTQVVRDVAQATSPHAAEAPPEPGAKEPSAGRPGSAG